MKRRKKRRTTHPRRRVARSPSRKSWDDAVNTYAKKVRKDLGKKLVTWIELANWDLYYGPLAESGGGYGAARAKDIAAGGKAYGFPGWQKAVKVIAENLSDVGDLYVDTFSGDWSDSEPDWGATDEEGVPYYNPEDWVHVDRREVLAHVVGKELVEYVR